MALFNFVIIPKLVDLVAFIDDHETKSGKQISIMKLNFVFMVINNVLLPLTGLATMKEFLNFTLSSLEA
jgi:hypothetical protein